MSTNEVLKLWAFIIFSAETEKLKLFREIEMFYIMRFFFGGIK